MSYDCGSKIGYLRASLAFALKDAELGDQARSIAEATLAAKTL